MQDKLVSDPYMGEEPSFLPSLSLSTSGICIYKQIMTARTSYIEHFALADGKGREDLIATFSLFAPSAETVFLKGQQLIAENQNLPQTPFT